MNTTFSDERPIFLQIAEQLEEAILSGEIPEEERTPSITDYAVTYKINPATALKGINLLVDAGLLYKKRGLGMYVAAGAREKLKARRRQAFYEDHVKPAAAEARQLEIAKDELLDMVRKGYEENGN